MVSSHISEISKEIVREKKEHMPVVSNEIEQVFSSK